MVIGLSRGKECCLNVSSRLWGGALRDNTKNGCEGDYAEGDIITIHGILPESNLIVYVTSGQWSLKQKNGRTTSPAKINFQ